MAVLAPIPSASVSTATMRNTGWRVKTRKAKRTSCRNIFAYTLQDRVRSEEKIPKNTIRAEGRTSRKIDPAQLPAFTDESVAHDMNSRAIISADELRDGKRTIG